MEAASVGGSGLRGVVDNGDLNDDKNGLGQFLDSAVALRAAVAMAIGFFGGRISSEIAQFVARDFDGERDKGMFEIRAVRQRNDQQGVG